MSRIAGTMGPWGSAVTHAMLEAMRAHVAVSPAIRAANGAHLGALDWREPNVAQHGPLTVVADSQMWTASAIVALVEKHGFVEALGHLDGDFAIAAYDSSTNTAWLARDRFAVKPLYFAVLSDGRPIAPDSPAARGGDAHGRDVSIAFASRTRALLEVPGITRAPNKGFVARFAGLHYRTFDNLPDESPYADIAQLPASTWLSFRGGKVERGVYWALAQQPDLADDEATLARRYRELLLDAVGRRRRLAHKPAFTLSGGMDSSSVIACSVHTTGQKEHAFSTVYHDVTYDETAEIRTILEPTVEKWHPIKIGDPDLADVIPKMLAVNDEPIATATWLSHYLLCEATREAGFGTLFGGLGGDELNAGEYEYFFYFFADLAASGDEAKLSHETAKWVEYHDHPIFKKSPEVMRAGLSRLVDLRVPGRCLPDPARLARYRDYVDPSYFDLSSYRPIMDEPFTSYLKNRTYQDIFRETAPCCLRAADRQATAHGIDISWPFFDHRLSELMFRVPATQKIRDGVTKHLLREAMAGIVPEATRTRIAKTGWNAPAHVWFATGSGRTLVLDLLATKSFTERGLYDIAKVRTLLDEHRDIVVDKRPVDNHMMFFWQLVNLELWLRAATS